jgi:hypothetical protein
MAESSEHLYGKVQQEIELEKRKIHSDQAGGHTCSPARHSTRDTPVFHVDLVRLASDDKLPSQAQDNTQPPHILVNNEEEYYVDSVLDKWWKKVGR